MKLLFISLLLLVGGTQCKRRHSRRSLNSVVPEPEPSTGVGCAFEGVWQNEHGSVMKLHKDGGRLWGTYITAVESNDGASGAGWTHLNGSVHGNLFTVHGFWNNGKSLTTWTGQCHKKCQPVHPAVKTTCPAASDDEETCTLYSSWILTSLVDNCQDKWMANRVGQDSFVKNQDGHHSNRINHTPKTSGHNKK